ncbi:MAG: hypothetical protein ACE5GV_05275 [Candidatus Scalindua sp.]
MLNSELKIYNELSNYFRNKNILTDLLNLKLKDDDFTTLFNILKKYLETKEDVLLCHFSVCSREMVTNYYYKIYAKETAIKEKADAIIKKIDEGVYPSIIQQFYKQDLLAVNRVDAIYEDGRIKIKIADNDVEEIWQSIISAYKHEIPEVTYAGLIFAFTFLEIGYVPEFAFVILYNDKNVEEAKTFTDTVEILFRSATSWFIEEKHRSEVQKRMKAIKSHGTKSAMTAIMSRNLSHNIGSHVISYWNNRLEDQLKRSQKELKEELKTFSSPLKDTDELPYEYMNEQKFIKSSKELLGYIQERMDFVAELSTSVPCSEMSMDIEKDIVNPFITPNDDKYGEQNTEISSLLSYIAHSEDIDLHKRIKFEIKEGVKDGRVSIPNGYIGKHAVYSILENFIRNAAKHYKGPDSPLLYDYDIVKENDIKMQKNNYTNIKNEIDSNGGNSQGIRDKLNKLIKSLSCVISNDDIENNFKDDGDKIKESLKDKVIEFRNTNNNEKKKQINRDLLELIFPNEIIDTIIKIEIDEKQNFKQDYLVMRLWDLRENSCSSEAIEDIRQYLPGQKNCQFTEDGSLAPGGWGIKEMVTCANFLRKNTPVELYNRLSCQDGILVENEPPLFKVLCDIKNDCTDPSNCSSKEHPDYKGKLGIEFYLRKPKDLAIVTDDSLNEDRKMGEKFGIYEINLQRYKDKEIPHRMLLVEGEGNYDDANKPCRIKKKNRRTNLNDNEYLNLYNKFIKEKLNNNKDLPKLAFFGRSFNGNVYVDVDNDSDDEKIGRIDKNLNFVHHLSDPKATKFTSEENGETLFNNNFTNSYYLQPVSAGYSTYAKLFGELPDDQQIKDHFMLELIESALTRVVIVDERVSEWAKRNFAFNKTNQDMLQKMRVFVPEVDRENIKFDDLKSKITKIPTGVNKCQFFVIHQGILDKLKKENNKDRDKKLMGIVKEKFKWIVIDSGRGVPENFDRYEEYKVRFVEISALQRLLENFDKHGLAQTLFSTRKPPITNKWVRNE